MSFGGERFELRLVVGRNAAMDCFQRERAIHRAAVEIEIVEFEGDATGDTALSGTGRAVNGDG